MGEGLARETPPPPQKGYMHAWCDYYFLLGDPITTEVIRYGMRVGVVVLPANPMLKTPEAMKVVGPSAFGFDIPYMEPRPLPGQH